MIYLDYAANPMVDKEVLDVYYETSLKYFANPNSFHKLGLAASEVIAQSSQHILNTLGLDDYEVIYTSGASESNNLVIKGICERYKNRGKHIILGSLEHNSLISAATTMQSLGFEISIVPLTKEGTIDINELGHMIRDDTILVSICSVDSELGIRQPIEEIGELLKDKSCYFHSDASQSIGKVNIDYSNVDLITLTPHKFYGINGSGALIKRRKIGLKPQIDGGRSTTIYRSGTPVIAHVVAMDKALTKAITLQKERYDYIQTLHDVIIEKLKEYNNIHINSTQYSVPHIINCSIKNGRSSKIIDKLEEHEVYVSAKTSCCPKNTPSKLVYALTHDKALSLSSLRISLSHLTTIEEVNEFIKVFDQCNKEIK